MLAKKSGNRSFNDYIHIYSLGFIGILHLLEVAAKTHFIPAVIGAVYIAHALVVFHLSAEVPPPEKPQPES